LIFGSFVLTLTASFTVWFPVALDFRMARKHMKCPPKFTLATILHDPAGFDSMASFLKLEFSAENAYFYQRVEEYRLPQNRGTAAAEYLFETFIASNSPYQVNLAATTVQSIAEKLQVTDTKPSLSSVFMRPSPQRPARTSTLDMTSVVGLRSSDSVITIAPEELTSLFDAAQNEVLRLMEKDSWVRYLQSPQFAVYARDHVRSAHEFADTIEKKMLSLPMSSASTISNPSRSVSKEKRSRGEPENTDRSNGSTGETLRSSTTGERLRSSTEKIRTSTLIAPESPIASETSIPVVLESSKPAAADASDDLVDPLRNVRESGDIEITITPSVTHGDPTAYVELV